MKLLYCSREYTTHDLRFVKAIVRAGIEVHYLQLESDGVTYVQEPLPEAVRKVEWEGGRQRISPREAVDTLVAAFGAVVDRVAPDVIHAGPVQSFGTLSAITQKAPTVLVSWGSDMLVDANRDDWHRWATATAVRGADGMICDSLAVLQRLTEFNGSPPDHFVCAPWGPELIPSPGAASRASVRESLGWKDSVIVIATRAWHRGYRVAELVERFARAASIAPELRLILAGDGEERTLIESIIHKHNLVDKVYLPGMTPSKELAAYLAASDIYMSMVPSDGTSISLLDAMANELVPVVVDNPGNREWVEDRLSGRLLSSEGWEHVLIDLAGDPAERSRLGESACQVVRERADWEANSRRFVELYREVAASWHQGSR